MRALIVALFMMCALPAAAQNVSFGTRGESLPVIPLTTFRAEPTESEELFVARVGTFLHRYTQANGFEACASLTHTNGELTARVSTNESQVGCLATLQPGDIPTGRTIQSHPEGQVLRLTAADNVFLRGNGGNHKTRMTTLRRSVGPSATDRQAAGYLVEGGIITFFAPGQADRVIGPIAQSPLPPSVIAARSSEHAPL